MTDIVNQYYNPEDLIEAIIDNKLSYYDLMKSIPKGDHLGQINLHRLLYVIVKRPGGLEALAVQNKKFMESAPIEIDTESIHKNIMSKNGNDRFAKLADLRAEIFNEGQSLLTSTDFDGCLAEYKKLISHVESLWDKACQEFKSKNYSFCVFISILVIEEIAKLSRFDWRYFC